MELGRGDCAEPPGSTPVPSEHGRLSSHPLPYHRFQFAPTGGENPSALTSLNPALGTSRHNSSMVDQPLRTECLVCCLPMRLSYQLPALAGHAGWEALKCDVCGAIRIFELIGGKSRHEVENPHDLVPAATED